MSAPATPGPASATFTGVYVPLVTPFDAEGAVALGALERLARDVLDDGASGLVALGTTAEPASLTPGERDATAVDLLADPPPGFSVLGGDDALISPLLALGAHGGILASAHLATRQFANLATAWSAGDAATARGLGRRLAPLSAALFAEPNPTVIKAVPHAQGRIPTPDVRLPLLPAAPASLATAAKYLGA